jgi:hypothetical protein
MMNELTYRRALSRRDELLPQAANHRLVAQAAAATEARPTARSGVAVDDPPSCRNGTGRMRRSTLGTRPPAQLTQLTPAFNNQPPRQQPVSGLGPTPPVDPA